VRHLHVMQPHTGLEIRDLACERGGKTLFEGLSLSVSPGQSLHLQGDNGSGKTSLLRLLCGLSPPTAGEVLWGGSPLALVRETYSRDMLYLGHALALKEGLSALENLQFAAVLMDQNWAPDAALQALHQMGLRGREHLPLQVLSQGQKRRVALARLGLSPARLWLLDEPFVALDTAACGVLQALMQHHVAGGGMVVFTSHQAVHLASGDNRSHRLGRA
jgi:heme exporter protein A